MIITGETPRLFPQETSGGGGIILGWVGALLFASLLVVGGKEFLEYKMEMKSKAKEEKK